jgi:hypothetical protein
MPVPVRLPSTAPTTAPAGLLAGLKERTRWRPPLLGAAVGGLAVIGAAAVGITVAMHHANNAPSLAQAPQSAAGFAGPRSAGSGAAAAPVPAAAPGDFPYSVSVPVPGRPGAVLVLATQRQTYAPGETVLILARVQTNGTSAGASAASPPALPDVRVLANVESPATATGGPAAVVPNSSDSLRTALLQAPHAASGPAYTDSLPLLTVTLPTTLRQGQVVSLVALLPDSQGQPQLVGVLALTIS